MNLVLWIIIGIVLSFFILTTLWIIFIFLKNSKKDYNLYKSVAKSVFARKISLSIIVIFYMISFGLVGGLTSALGRLNKEATTYIKQNHLYQGAARKTYFSENSTAHTFDQKSFYLATQGVIDFYNENLNKTEANSSSSETTFLDMLGGQDANGDGEITLKEKLDGSTSPLSYQKNLSEEEDTTVYGHNFSIHDIGQFWNVWYEGSSEFTCVDPDNTDPEHWLTYWYNGTSHTYNNSEGHSTNENGIISQIEKFANETIFFDNNENTNVTFATLIEDENNGLDNFSEVVFVLFNNEINKYFSTIGTFFFEYYLNLYDESHNNLFASSKTFEYQKTIRGADYLLQSYNQNEVENNSLVNNPINNLGTDKHGDYAVNTVTFYDDKGNETVGPNYDDEFFNPHEGTSTDPYQVYVSTEYYEEHNLNEKVGESQKLKASSYGFYYQIKGSYRSPTYSFPMQTVSSSLQKPENNAAILINTQSLLRLTRGQKYSTTSYEFFGFSNVYDETNKATDWYYPPYLNEVTFDETCYPAYVALFSECLNSFYGDSSWNYSSEDPNDGYFPQTYMLEIEGINNLRSVISYRSFTIIREIAVDGVIYTVIMAVFLVITIIVLILLIRKRIQDSNKQLGTIKALGYDPSRIASAYTIFPIIIILLGGILALIVALPLSLFFSSLYSGFFSLNLMTPYVGLILWLKIFIIPLILSMFLGYWMAYHTIRKPTLDLLNNVGKDKPNLIVRGTSHLIPSFASFEFTYKTKGIGRAFCKSLLLFCAILGSMSITSFAFASSTMSATITKEVFDIIDYQSKKWEFGAPFIEDININDVDENYDDPKDEPEMKAFDLFSNSKSKTKLINGELIIYVTKVLRNPEDALAEFNNLYFQTYLEDGFNFEFKISSDIEGNPVVTSDYYVEWKTAIALWITDLALHVPVEEEENSDLNEPIKPIEKGTNSKNKSNNTDITFNMLDPILRNYAINLSANVVTRYGKDTTFEIINFIYKVFDDYNGDNEEPPDGEALRNDWEVALSWFRDHNIIAKIDSGAIGTILEEEYIFNDIVFNKNYYDGEVRSSDGTPDPNEEINQTMTTASSGYFLQTDLRGNLIPNKGGNGFKETTTYMEGYHSIGELQATNNINPTAMAHVAEPSNEDVVNIAMTQSEFKEVERYKKATPLINKYLKPDQAKIFAKTRVWDTEDNTYEDIFIPVVFDIEIYDSIYPLGSFFLQDEMDKAINYSLDNNLPDSDGLDSKSWYTDYGYGELIDEQLKIAENAAYEPNYSVTYNIATNNEDIGEGEERVEQFKTAPFSVSLSQNGLINKINENGFDENKPIELAYLVNNVYIPFAIPLSIDIIIDQGSRMYELLQGIFYVVAFFALFIGITIVMIAMKDIMDSNKREVSMFKAFGYSNWKATTLVITPYLFVIVFAFLIAIPISLAFLSAIGTILTFATGTTYVFALVIWQWIVVIGFIIWLVIFLGFIGYQSYLHTNALEAINETNE